MRPLIGYVRVSTSKQGRSGLGIEAQQEALTRFAEAEGFELVRMFVEIETGKGRDAIERRPQLAAALGGEDCGVVLSGAGESLGGADIRKWRRGDFSPARKEAV